MKANGNTWPQSLAEGKLSVWSPSGFISSAMKLMLSANEYNPQNNFPRTGCCGYSIQEKQNKTNKKNKS